MERSSIGGRRPRAYKEKMDESNVNIEDEEEEDEEENEDIIGDDGGESGRRRVRLSTRPRGSGAGAPPPCQAENCHADLSNAKRYYQRHKVCEVHANAPIVLVAGIHQRFCQQCSRFHELAEFDDTKKSCRRRLAGHNERRRKSSS